MEDTFTLLEQHEDKRLKNRDFGDYVLWTTETKTELFQRQNTSGINPMQIMFVSVGEYGSSIDTFLNR